MKFNQLVAIQVDLRGKLQPFPAIRIITMKTKIQPDDEDRKNKFIYL